MVDRRANLDVADARLSEAMQLQALTGLQILQGIREGTIPPPPFATLLGMRLVEIEPGRAVFEANPGDEHYHPFGAVHGGFAMSLLDSALACAVSSTLPAGTSSATIDIHVRLLRPITRDSGKLRCEAQVVSSTRTLATSEGKIIDASGKVLATGTAACAIREARS